MLLVVTGLKVAIVEHKRLSTGICSSCMGLSRRVFRIRLDYPLLEEQSAISVFVQRISANTDRASRLMRKEVVTLQEYRTRPIADVVTGKLNVRQATLCWRRNLRNTALLCKRSNKLLQTKRRPSR